MSNCIKVISNKTGEVHIFDNQRQASERLGINVNLITRVFKTGKQRKDYMLFKIGGGQYSAQQKHFKEYGQYSPFDLTLDNWNNPAFRD